MKATSGVSIKIETLNYNGGPAKVNVAIASGTVPDIIDDDPVRLKALDAVKSVKGIYPTALWAGNEQADVGMRMVLQTFGAKLFTPDGRRLSLNDAAGVKGMEFLVGLKQKGYLAPGSEAMMASDAVDLFHQGRIALSMQYDSSQLLPLRLAQKAGRSPVSDVALLPYPSVPGVSSGTSLALTGVAVFKTADQAKITAGKLFAKWLCMQEDIVLNSIGTVPAVKGMRTYGQTRNDPEVAFVDGWGGTHNIYAGKVTTGWAEVRAKWYPNFHAALTGAKMPKQALDDFVAAANDVLAIFQRSFTAGISLSALKG
jgi:ABC-type glycerol-3-phosphate transport system substrate-binding protein